MFSLNKENGEISMNGRVPRGEYSIKVNVYDAVWDLNVESTVKIVVKNIEEEAVLSSGSLRFQGKYRLHLWCHSVHFRGFDSIAHLSQLSVGFMTRRVACDLSVMARY